MSARSPAIDSDASGPPPAEIRIDAGLVRRLLAEQHPDLAGLPLEPFDSGWDNAHFRLGSKLLVRLPRRAVGARLLVHEQRWLPRLAGLLPLPVPAPVRTGRAAADYPWSWSIVPRFDGLPADLVVAGNGLAEALGHFLGALHRVPRPDEAPRNPFRDVPLEQKARTIEPRLEKLRNSEPGLPIEGLREVWERGRDADVDLPSCWIHGDLHPRNVLLDAAGAPAAVLDWGDLTSGDPATDLAALWMLLPNEEAREKALAVYGAISPATRNRARSWAAYLAILFLDAGLARRPDAGRDLTLGRRLAALLT